MTKILTGFQKSNVVDLLRVVEVFVKDDLSYVKLPGCQMHAIMIQFCLPFETGFIINRGNSGLKVKPGS